MTRLPFNFTIVAFSDVGPASDPLDQVGPLVARLRRDGFLLDDAAIELHISWRPPSYTSIELKTIITVDEPASAFTSPAARALLALQLLTGEGPRKAGA